MVVSKRAEAEIKMILQKWASSVLSHWFDMRLGIDEVVKQIVAVMEEEK